MKKDRLGVILDMNQGILGFGLYLYNLSNGECWGIGFQSEKLKNGPIYAAVALLHNAGCILVTGKAPPSYFHE